MQISGVEQSTNIAPAKGCAGLRFPVAGAAALRAGLADEPGPANPDGFGRYILDEGDTCDLHVWT